MNEYYPDYVSHPGETLEDVLVELGISRAELARRTGRSKRIIDHIIQGEMGFSLLNAQTLESILGVPASFWNNRERQYQEAKARIEGEL